jgi:YebC/PmpR family DNA-binding regulatory protein
MSGHSKWANIKNRKGAQDKKRSEAFTKISKNIMTAIRLGGGNTNSESNVHLKTAIDKAKEVSMPKENIERLLQRFEERKANLTNFNLEGYGPYGVPIVIEVETDNKNRTLGEIKSILREYGASLGESNSVMFQFKKVGEVEFESIPEDKELELIDAGAQDFEDNIAIVEATDLNSFTQKANEMGLSAVRSEALLKAINPIMLQSEDEVGKILDLVDALEENDDVINVSAGFDYVQKT